MSVSVFQKKSPNEGRTESDNICFGIKYSKETNQRPNILARVSDRILNWRNLDFDCDTVERSGVEERRLTFQHVFFLFFRFKLLVVAKV